jgi:precorrin isomerase
VTKSNSGSSDSSDIITSRHNSASKKKWEDMIDQSVHTTDDVDIGDIDALSRDFIVAKRGYLNEHYY